MPRPPALVPPSAVRAIDRVLAKRRQDTCQIGLPATTGRDAGGAVVTTPGGWSAPIPCLVKSANYAPNESIGGGRVAPEASVIITMDRAVAVDRGNKIRHVESGQIYESLNDPDVTTDGFQIRVQGKDTNG